MRAAWRAGLEGFEPRGIDQRIECRREEFVARGAVRAGRFDALQHRHPLPFAEVFLAAQALQVIPDRHLGKAGLRREELAALPYGQGVWAHGVISGGVDVVQEGVEGGADGAGEGGHLQGGLQGEPGH